jgi:hypothetical protein
MNIETFDKLVEARIEKIRVVLLAKGKEYALNSDRLENFVRGAELLHTTPARCCWAYLAKHLISIATMLESGKEFSAAVWDEKISDAVNYLVLLEACFQDARRTQGDGLDVRLQWRLDSTIHSCFGRITEDGLCGYSERMVNVRDTMKPGTTVTVIRYDTVHNMCVDAVSDTGFTFKSRIKL